MSSEEIKERKRRYAEDFRTKHPEKTRAYAKGWYERNREYVLKKRADERTKRQEEKQELERLKLLLSQQGVQV
nr:hypothetical protein MarFTME_322 [Marseillevirus futianmevirus]